MKFFAGVIDNDALNPLAARVAEEITVAASHVERETFIQIILKALPRCPSTVSRIQFFKTYDRVEIDIVTSEESLHQPSALRDLILAAADLAIAELRLSAKLSLPSRSVGAFPLVVKRRTARNRAGVLLFSILAKKGGVSMKHALEVVKQWVDEMGLAIDGEIDSSAEHLDVYIGTERGVTREARKFLHTYFASNGVIAINTDETVIAEWS